MKRNYKFLIIVLFFVPLISHGALIDNLVSYWNFDEASGVRVDSTASANDLTDNNTVGSATGVLNLGSDFESSNSEYFSILDSSQIGLDFSTVFSVSMWIKPESSPPNNSDEWSIFDKHFTALNMSYTVRYSQIGGVLMFHSRFSTSGSSSSACDINYDLGTGTFRHVLFVFDSSVFEIYINGASIGTCTATGETPLYDGVSTFELGGGPAGYFDGIIDEVGAWSVVLTPEQDSLLYNSGTGCFYPFTDDCVEGGGGGGTSTSTATSTTPYTLEDWLFVQQWILFFLAFISMGIVFSIFKKDKKRK